MDTEYPTLSVYAFDHAEPAGHASTPAL
jgi:hypothetical protein